MEEYIENYLNYRGCNIVNVRRFCKELFAIEIPADMKKNISLHFVLLPLPINGLVDVKRRKEGNQYRIWINLLCTMLAASKRMRLFYFCVTLLHEINHVFILEKANMKRYSELIAYWEESRYFYQCQWSIVQCFRKILMLPQNWSTQKRRYKMSVSESQCNLNAFRRAYDMFFSYLNAAEHERIQNMIRSLEFLKENITIGYSNGGQPYNLFPNMISELQKMFNETPNLFQQCGPMSCVFTESGDIKSLEQMFKERNEENKSIIDGLLINWFICAETKYTSSIAKNDSLKQHMEKLLNEFIKGVIQYLESEKKGLIFIDKEMLNDNTCMLIKNAERLYKLATAYGMDVECRLIPFYHTGT